MFFGYIIINDYWIFMEGVQQIHSFKLGLNKQMPSVRVIYKGDTQQDSISNVLYIWSY